LVVGTVVERSLGELDVIADIGQETDPGCLRKEAFDEAIVDRAHSIAVAEEERVLHGERIVVRGRIPSPFESAECARTVVAFEERRLLREVVADTGAKGAAPPGRV
jgi:hypothetical protein